MLEARRNEIDLEQAAWTVPASRMKAGREHRVPLAPRCLDLLQQAKLLAAGNEFVFPGRSNDKAMSNMVWLMTMRRLKSPKSATAPTCASTARGFTQKGAASDIAALIDQSIRERVEQQIPLVEIAPEIRKELIETLDRAIEAMCTLGVGLAQAMNTLMALQSETSDFPEIHRSPTWDNLCAGADRSGSATGNGWGIIVAVGWIGQDKVGLNKLRRRARNVVSRRRLSLGP